MNSHPSKKKDIVMHRVKMEGEFENSTILKKNQVQDLKNVLDFPDRKERLLYRGSRDGWSSSYFHHFCDDKGPTVTLIKVKNTYGEYISGGYTDKSWDCCGNFKRTSNSFLFSLVISGNLRPVKLPLISGREGYAMYCDADHGPTFGYEEGSNGETVYDLHIVDEPNRELCSSFLERCYHYPLEQNAIHILTGGHEFTVAEVEVYGIHVKQDLFPRLN